MKNIVLKSALFTLAAAIVAAVIAVIILFFGFPKTTAGIFENAGNYKFASRFAAMQYSRSHDIDDLGRTVMDSIFAEDDEYLVKYGSELVEKSNFDAYCQKQDDRYSKGDKSEYRLSFKQYVCGQVACAVYRSEDIDKALAIVDKALEGVDGFPTGNALVPLVVEVSRKGDGEVAVKLRDRLKNITPKDSEKEYYQRVTSQLNSIIGED